MLEGIIILGEHFEHLKFSMSLFSNCFVAWGGGDGILDNQTQP